MLNLSYRPWSSAAKAVASSALIWLPVKTAKSSVSAAANCALVSALTCAVVMALKSAVLRSLICWGVYCARTAGDILELMIMDAPDLL